MRDSSPASAPIEATPAVAAEGDGILARERGDAVDVSQGFVDGALSQEVRVERDADKAAVVAKRAHWSSDSPRGWSFSARQNECVTRTGGRTCRARRRILRR